MSREQVAKAIALAEDEIEWIGERLAGPARAEFFRRLAEALGIFVETGCWPWETEEGEDAQG